MLGGSLTFNIEKTIALQHFQSSMEKVLQHLNVKKEKEMSYSYLGPCFHFSYLQAELHWVSVKSGTKLMLLLQNFCHTKKSVQ